MKYCDSYTCEIAGGVNIDVAYLPKLFIQAMPKSMEALIMLRESIAKRVGLKTADGRESILRELKEFDGNIGSKIGLFQVIERSDDRLVTGQDDRHLNFRLTFLVKKENPQKIILTTDVTTHNLMGNIYFLSVMPVHKIIMPWVLKRMKRMLEQGQLTVV